MRIQVGARADAMIEGHVLNNLGRTMSCKESDLVPGGICRQSRWDFL
jgi:hypothetical protein